MADNATTTPNLDPTIVNLAKAIRQVESNNTSTAGKSGEQGRYQWMPDTWKAVAGQYLGDPNAPITLENENKAAYSRIKAWKDQGYNPGQIASMWNSGKPDPNATGSGVNASGAAYDVPKYVKDVYDAYNTFKGQSDTPAAPSAPPTDPRQGGNGGFMQNVFGNGQGNWFEGLLQSTIGSKGIGGLIARPISSAMTAGAETPVAQSKDQLAQTTAALLKKIKTLAPNDPQRASLMQTVQENQKAMGMSDEEMKNLEANVETQEQNLGIAANTAATLSTGAAAPATAGLKILQGAGIGAESGFGNAAANNASAKDVAESTALGATIGAAIPAVTSLLGTIVKNGVGALSGTGSKVIQQAIDNPGEVSDAISAYAKNPEGKMDLVSRAKDAIGKFLQGRNEAYGSALDGMTAKAGFQGKQAVVDSFEENIAKFGGKISQKEGSVGDLVFTDSPLSKADQANLQEAWQKINEWQNTSVKGLDGLRQAIGNLMDDFKFAGNSRANVVLGNVKGDLTSALSDATDGAYKDMLSKYGQQTQVSKNLLKELSLAGSAKPSTQLNQIMKLFNKDPQVMDALVQVMGKDGAQAFQNDIAGAILSSWTPIGSLSNLFRTVGEVGAGVEAVASGNPWLGAATVASLGASSPRIAGNVATAFGGAAEKGITKTLSQTAESTVPRIFPFGQQ